MKEKERKKSFLSAILQSCNLQSCNRKGGFTLVELLIVIAIIAISSVAGFVSLGNYRGRQAVQSAVDGMSSVVRATRQRSMAQESGGRWGIRFTNATTGISFYTTFRGYTFATGTVDRQYPLPSNVLFSNPFASSTYDMVFAPLTGAISEAKVLSVVSGRGSAPVGDLVVKSNGSAVSRLESGLVGYWHLDEGISTKAYDASGKSNIGTLTNGPTWQMGLSCKAGGCLSFDSATQKYVSGGAVVVSTNITLSAWIYPTSYPSERSTIILGTGAYYLSLANDGSLQTYWYGKSSVGYHSSGANTVLLNQWSYVVATWDTSNVILYVNGVLKNSISSAGAGNAATGLNIGAESVARQFIGRIDEVRIYSRALSATEIQATYNDLK